MRVWLRDFQEQLKMRFLEWLALDGQKCQAFGGVSGYGYNEKHQAGVTIRLCGKNRWHTDSHAYEEEVHRLYERNH